MALAAALFVVAGCSSGGGDAGEGTARVVLNTDTSRPTIDIVGVPDRQLAELGALDSREAWSAVFKIAVGPDQPAMLGQYTIEERRIRFTPMFPLDRGRQYHVVFMPSGMQPVTATVSLPAPDTTPTTVVSHVYPTAEVLPENQLRLYIHFSGPMGLRGGLDFVHLLDDAGRQVKDPFLPLDAEFWNDDRTRYTVFFDPGRQKRGIAPIADMGRSLTDGKSYTLVVDSEWRDGNGLPLRETYRRTFKVGPPDEKPLDPKTWRIQTPLSGTNDPLVVTFPEPLDHGLLLRALGVLGAGGRPIDGQVKVGPHELTWSFAPADPWKGGGHNIVAFASLEDLAGN
ncbi:MAG TPA: hypothetical protein VEA16_18105, partial [Vicinamibacterales bacterium]|nr:hypothetical protein [Vicinamibacterales bacterium]